jgi:cell division protein FtsX
MKTKPIPQSSTIAAIVAMIVIAGTTLAVTTTLNAFAQTAASSEQIKKSLTQAIQALDSGDNTKAVQQLKVAADQLGTLTGVSVSGGESDDKGEGVEEGPGEDADEPGDTDVNDNED